MVKELPIDIKTLNENENYTCKLKKCTFCEDVTDYWFKSSISNTHEVKDGMYFEHNGIKYVVDGKNVVLEYSLKELEIAEWLENTFGGEIYMLPRVNQSFGIQTADYLFRGEYWDLKEISGNSK